MGRWGEGEMILMVVFPSKLDNLSKLIWVKYPTVYRVHKIGWGQIPI
ncbi:MAG: hypothetical protein F6K58_30310 [Symploca sp. SIO2E9]|nr:hypothetical protein [Symploca sp. SIO2E9]